MESLRYNDIIEVSVSFTIAASRVQWRLKSLTTNVVSLTNPSNCNSRTEIDSSNPWTTQYLSELYRVTTPGDVEFALHTIATGFDGGTLRGIQIYGRVLDPLKKIGNTGDSIMIYTV